MSRWLTLTAAALVLAACENGPEPQLLMPDMDPAAVFLEAPDPSFRLTAEERAQIHPALNADAVERLLMWTRPEYRTQGLDNFLFLTRRYGPNTPIAISSVDLKVGHPEIDAIVNDLIRRPARTGREIRSEGPER